MAQIVARRCIVVLMFALTFCGCASVDVNDYCRWSDDFRPSSLSYDDISVAVGLPQKFVSENHYLLLSSPSQTEPTRQLRLSLLESGSAWPVDLDESNCRNLDWRLYSAQYDDDEWSEFWSHSHSEWFEVAFAPLNSTAPLSVSSFGLALVSEESHESIVSCGCYWR